MAKLDLSPLDNDGGSYDEIIAVIGVEGPVRLSEPGDIPHEDAAVMLYWPTVPECYEVGEHVRLDDRVVASLVLYAAYVEDPRAMTPDEIAHRILRFSPEDVRNAMTIAPVLAPQ